MVRANRDQEDQQKRHRVPQELKLWYKSSAFLVIGHWSSVIGRLEGSHSGLVRRLGKAVSGKPDRGFESPILRMKNIVLFGDSLFGRFGREYMLRLESLLPNSTIYNCAAGGCDTRDGLKCADFIATLESDVVCLSFGVNDSNPFKGQPVPIEEFESNLDSIIKAFSASTVILFPCPPVHDPNDPDGTREFNEVLERYNQVIKDLAAKNGSQCINSKKIYGTLAEHNQEYHLEDGLHLNDLGYRTLIKQLAGLLQRDETIIGN
jgi:lysophospholipase L1-like esterase